jgi:hypothetical protein
MSTSADTHSHCLQRSSVTRGGDAGIWDRDERDASRARHKLVTNEHNRMALDTALSTASTLFAAVAAWGAVRAIQMARDATRDRALGDLLGALAEVQHAADSLTAPRTEQDWANAVDLFFTAQRDLARALAVPVAIYSLADITQIQENIDYLRRARPDMPPREIWFKAMDASLLLSSKLMAPATRRSRREVR